MEERLAQLEALRTKAHAELTALRAARKVITDKVEAELREDFTADETVEFRAKGEEIKTVQERIADLDAQVRELKEEIERSGRLDPDVAPIVRRTSTEVNEPLTYRQGDPKASYFRDLGNMALGQADEGIKARLRRHAQDVNENDEIRKLAKVGPEYRDLDRSDGSGGYLVPPLWMMKELVELARAGRPYANLAQHRPLPSGTDSLNIPKIGTGTSTAVQTADNATISETDLADTSVEVPVRTIAGAQGVAIQAIEQSPLPFDDIIFSDLARAYATNVDTQVISGSGSNGQVRGVRNTSNIITVTATSTDSELVKAQVIYKKIADAIQRVHVQRFAEPEVIVMHPRRWAAFTALFDGDDRPLLITAGPGVNQVGDFGGVVAQKVVGTMHGLPVVTDISLPTTLGAGTNEDVIHVLKASDLWLFESALRMRALQETRAENLTVLLQLYGYVAFTAGRQVKGICEVGGTACTEPTFA